MLNTDLDGACDQHFRRPSEVYDTHRRTKLTAPETISRFSDRPLLVDNRRFNLPHLSLAPPLGVTPLEFRLDLWRQETRMIALSCGIKISLVGSLD